MNVSKMIKITTCNQFNFHLQNSEIIIFPIVDSTIYFLLDEDDRAPVMCMQNKNGKLNVTGFSETKMEEIFCKYKAIMYVEKGAKLSMNKNGFKLKTQEM